MRSTIPFALALFGLATVIANCKTPSPTQAQIAAEGAYGAELLRCVDAAKTLAESKACRAVVDAKWGVVQTARDGGDQ